MGGPVGRLAHYGGTATSAGITTVNLNKRGFSLVIANADTTNTLGVSFDGRNFFTVQPKTYSPTFEGSFNKFYVNTTASAAWTVVTVEG